MGNSFSGKQDVPISPDNDDFLPASGNYTNHYSKDAIGNEFDNAKIKMIENELDFNEKVSMVYLLFNNAKLALHYLTMIQNGLKISVLEELVHLPGITQTHLLEALCIIQNYKILQRFGYTNTDMHERFLPFNTNTSITIDKTKKNLYRISEDFESYRLQQFLALVQEDFKDKKLVFKTFPGNYLEMYLLYWATIEYISPSNYLNLARIFKQMEMYTIYDYLKSVGESQHILVEANNRHIDAAILDDLDIGTRSMSNLCFANNQGNARKISYLPYIMNYEAPGVCLIINQEMFYTEPDPALQYLLPDTEGMLEQRVGTEIDCSRIKRTMKSIGFTVIVKNNLDHNDILTNITEVAMAVKKDDSSLFIYILSHGIEGHVYGSNSIPVNVKDIQATICQTNVQNLCYKPKVLIIQACQGTACQEVIKLDNDIQMDGPSYSSPKTANFLEFWATVPGYGAIRDKKKGTWFIQSLCDKIEENSSDFHLEDICTMVIQDVINKRWGNKTMVPIKKSTLTAPLFFPPIKRGF